MNNVMVFLAALFLVVISFIGPVGISIVGPAISSSEVPSKVLKNVSNSYKHTTEVCYVFINEKKDSYCKVLTFKYGRGV